MIKDKEIKPDETIAFKSPMTFKVKNDKEKELQTWQALIQPIIDGYGIRGIKYEFVPVEYNVADRIKMERFTAQLCRRDKSFSSFHELMLLWQNKTPNGAFPFETSFIKVMNHLIQEKTLPHFLEFLYKEYQDEMLTKSSQVEKVIKNLIMSYENDDGIRIQEAGKQPKVFTCQSLGFKSNRTCAWKDLLRILQEPEHVFSVGPALTVSGGIKQRHKEYDRKQKRLSQINAKLIEFFNKEFSAKIPNGYKLFELARDMGPGKYRPKFKIVTPDDKPILKTKYERYSKDQLIDEMESLAKKYRETEDTGILERLTVISEIVLRRKWRTSDEVEKIINPNTDKETIKGVFSESEYDPYESEKNEEM